jgi:holo-[acyl-carrier protein] synthase
MPSSPMRWSWATPSHVRAYLALPARRRVIYGIGTDICDVRRIRASLERHGDRFAHKILSERSSPPGGAQRPLAGARRALPGHALLRQGSLQQGRRPGHAHAHDLALCEVGKLPSGKPVIVLHGELKDWCEARGLTAMVSVTDETDYAASFVVVEQKEKTMSEHAPSSSTSPAWR